MCVISLKKSRRRREQESIEKDTADQCEGTDDLSYN